MHCCSAVVPPDWQTILPPAQPRGAEATVRRPATPVSKANGKVSYCVGHVEVVKGDFTDSEGRPYAAEETFISDQEFDSQRDAEQRFAQAVLLAEREAAAATPAVPKKRTRRKKTA
jgi:hypothetical protein